MDRRRKRRNQLHRVQYWLQYLGAYLLAIFAAAAIGWAVFVRWDESSGMRAGYFLGFPLGCVVGLYIGSKVLLKTKGLHMLATLAGLLVMLACQALILVVPASCSEGFVLACGPAVIVIGLGYLVVAEAGAVRLTAAAFNSLIDFAAKRKATTKPW